MLEAYVAGNCFIFKAPINNFNTVKVFNLLTFWKKKKNFFFFLEKQMKLYKWLFTRPI